MDRFLDRLNRAEVLALSACGVAVVGGVDYVTGYEVSLSLLYLGPVALAAWYAGGGTGVTIAVLSCVGWYVADFAAGNRYSHPAIPVWNALVRFGFFLVTSLLLSSLRSSLLKQRHLARTDGLTGLCSRRTFEDRLEHDLALARRRRAPVTLAYVDLDDFKAVNDARGHAAGDSVLQATGAVLKEAVRQSDTAARLGGDEFALLLIDTDAGGARQVVAKLVRELEGALAAAAPKVTCSVGVVTFLEPPPSVAEAVAAADALMYEVKRRGKGAVAFRVAAGAVETSEPFPASSTGATSDPATSSG